MTLVQILIFAYVIKVLNFILCCMMMPHPSKDYFLYFAYGSNLYKRRIRINNPSAEFIGIGFLENHRLDFVKFFQNWGGSVATIVPMANEIVWGAVWKLHKDAIATLDKQEGVESREYLSKIVQINAFNGKKVECRTYQHTCIPSYCKLVELPQERKPSITYKDCILKGAIECDLPGEYIDMLKDIPNNGKFASDDIRKRLNL